MRVHQELGHGFLEDVYGDAFAIELKSQGIPFEREHLIKIKYQGITLDSFYKADFICNDELIVELKAIKTITSVERAQVCNYIKATGLSAAVLINFGAPSLQFNYMTRDWIDDPSKNIANGSEHDFKNFVMMQGSETKL